MRVMPLGAQAANRAGRSAGAAWRYVAQDGRRGLRGKNGSVRKPGSHRRQCTGSVMMKAAPAAPFKVPQPEFLLQFLVIALNNPAVFGEIDQFAERCLGWKRGKPVFRGLLFLLGPFHQKPFFRMRLGAPVIAVSGPYTKGGEAGDEFVFHASSPRDIRPCLRGQRQGELFCAERLMLRVSLQKSGR